MRRAIAWIAAAIAAFGTLVTLITNADTLANLVTDRAQQRDAYQQLLGAADRQLGDGRYEQAWASLSDASKQRVSGGWKLAGLTSVEEIETRQANVAMMWLRNIRLHGNDVLFTPVVDKLEPALDRAIAKSNGARKADILAHLGYAGFLRSRDGNGGASPEPRYREALDADPDNPFANAMLAHWIAWRRGEWAEVEALFHRAIASGRERAFVRRFQLAALRNGHAAASKVAALRLANDMRMNGEVPDADLRALLDGIYFRHAYSADDRDHVVSAMPPREHIATIRWLTAGRSDDPGQITYDFYTAVLEAASGHIATAREQFRALRQRVSSSSSLELAVKDELDRLGPP